VEPGEEDVDIKEVKQRLKKIQHVIAQLYQENIGLRRKLAEIIPKTQASQSKVGQRSATSPTEGEKNITWLKKQLREAQNEIIKLKE
jgi:predicted RNase H-like nuclease (RuvC/YqgF family)